MGASKADDSKVSTRCSTDEVSAEQGEISIFAETPTEVMPAVASILAAATDSKVSASNDAQSDGDIWCAEWSAPREDHNVPAVARLTRARASTERVLNYKTLCDDLMTRQLKTHTFTLKSRCLISSGSSTSRSGRVVRKWSPQRQPRRPRG